MTDENLFTGTYLDRRAEARLNADWLAEARADRDTLYVGLLQGAALVRPGASDGLSRLAFLPGTDPRVAASADPESLVLLGWYQGRRCVLVDLDPARATPQQDEVFAELKPLVSELPASEAALAAYARALSVWRANHRFCGRCGTLTVTQRAGHARRCPVCDYESFPRLDPAIIVLVHDGEQALLGRQANWAPGRYSTLAGFVEPGESLEDAIRREVHEEAGIDVREVTYHSSQPWPFPSSLMLGFTASADAVPPVLHDGELEDARWFSHAQLLDGAVLLPPRQAIARRLIDDWLQAR